MKSYTNIEQSKKLAEILPINTADCCYIKYCTSDNNEWRYDGQPPMILGEIPITEITAECIPCWSLAALFNYLREINFFPEIDVDKSVVIMSINYYEKEAESLLSPIHNVKIKAENFIDACVEMIEKLYKRKML